MSAQIGQHRETLHEAPACRIYRSGRFLVTELLGGHAVLSTSVRNGGYSESVRYLLNHQSCEAASHTERHGLLHKSGLEQYHDIACRQAGLDPGSVALMGTAANMNYASIVHAESGGVAVTAVVTAGVGGNAACAADPTSWSEGANGFEQVSPYDGTINTKVLISRPLKPGAMMTAAMVMTEAKGAALQRLAVRSKYSHDFATGTNTDQFCIACPRDGLPPLTSASAGVRLGELIGRAVRDATLEALRWQNGLEASYARSIFHALGRFGVSEESFLSDMAGRLGQSQWDLLKANRKAVVFEPMVAAAAFAIATVLDRVRHGILPANAAREALRQQGASMAASLAAQPDRWPEFYRVLGPVDLDRPAALVLDALAMGWAAKWS
jgi:adenosylcobinamide amidohydrolase